MSLLNGATTFDIIKMSLNINNITNMTLNIILLVNMFTAVMLVSHFLIIMLSVVILNVVMLGVVTPYQTRQLNTLKRLYMKIWRQVLS